MKTITFFTATWCPFCVRLAPHVEGLADQYDAVVEYIDVEEHPDLFKQTGSSTIPTLVIGEEILINPTPPQVKRALR